MKYLIDALNNLLGEAEWRINDEDLSTLEILTENVTKPSNKAIKDEITRLENKAKELPALKLALYERLGITEDEAKLLLS